MLGAFHYVFNDYLKEHSMVWPLVKPQSQGGNSDNGDKHIIATLANIHAKKRSKDEGDGGT